MTADAWAQFMQFLQILLSLGLDYLEKTLRYASDEELAKEVGDLRRWRILKQGDTWLSFFERN